MASKSAQQEPEKGEVIEELLDDLDVAVERVKVLYEQYFLGIQKQPPAFLHTDIERKIRELSQHQIRNTALRYRFVTLQQKFGAYNAYWKRTLRQIENGTYARNLSKIGRQAARTGAEIPEEILAAMPKRMREQVRRDREAALATAARRGKAAEAADDRSGPRSSDRGPENPYNDTAAIVSTRPDFETEDDTSPHSSGTLPRAATPKPFHLLDEDADFDVEAMFAAISSDDAPSRGVEKPAAKPAPPAPAPPPPAPPVTKSPEPVRAAAIVPPSRESRPIPVLPKVVPRVAPSQQTRSIPVMPGAAAAKVDAPAELAGPFVREPAPAAPAAKQATTQLPKIPPPIPPPPGARPLPPLVPPPPANRLQATPAIPAIKPPPAVVKPVSQPIPVAKPEPPPAKKLPPGMSEADVNALYAKFVKAKEMVGEKAGPGAYGKLVQTINAQAPKIIEQYKAKGVDFSVVVKDNQVIIRAKPKP